MKRARVRVIAAAVLAVATLAMAQQRPDFSGTWTLDPEASTAPGGGGRAGRGGGMGMMGPMTVKQTGDTLTIERQGSQGTITTTYKLDGSESRNPGGRGGESVSVAKWDGNNLVITTKQQMQNQTIETTQTWSLQNGLLTVERTGGRGGATKQVYKKST